MWRAAQRRERARFWPAVERYLASLPPRLFEQAKLLEYDLAVACSSTGRFADVFLGAEWFPALSVGSWLLADVASDLALARGPAMGRTGEPVAGAEERLFLASVLLVARTHIVSGILDRTSPYDADRFALAQLFTERSLTELAALVPASSGFWQARETAAADALEASVAASRAALVFADDGAPEAFLVPRWSTPATIIGRAALELCGADRMGFAVGSMLVATAEAFEIVATLRSFHSDALEGRTTYPIAVVARAAGLPVPHERDATSTLGALVATGALGAILDDALERIRRAHGMAADLGLATFGAFLGDAATELDGRRASIVRREPPTPREREPRRPPLVAISRPAGATALAMAEAFLLADPTFHESWETHREGMFGSPLVESRFPAGLVLEILARHGLDVAAEIDAFLDATARAGFRYYDHPSSEVDTDTIGVFLRLAAAVGRQHDVALAPALERLERGVASKGGIPVWLPREPSERDDDGGLDLGEGCGTVAAHLLLGLLAYAPARYASLIERGSGALLDRIAEVGVAANVNYPRGFALAAFGRLLSALGGRSAPARGSVPSRGSAPASVGTQGRTSVDRARHALLDDLERSIVRPPATAQDAALMTISCLDLDRPDLLEPAWATRILKAQRSDGAWAGEPFAAAPTRGSSVTWYSSALLTTALCYDGLVRSAT